MRNHRLIVPAVAGGLLCIAATFAGPMGAQDDEITVEVHAVRGPIHWIQGRGGNVGVSVGEDGVLLIDSQFEFMAAPIAAAVAELGGGEPAFLVNTHWHGDHVGGNGAFGRTATIVAHENVRRRMSGDQSMSGRVPDMSAPAEALPQVTYTDSAYLHFNGERIRLQHLPTGHTDGDTVVWFEGSNVVQLGDLYFSAAFPYVDLRSGGSIRGYVESLDAVLAEVDPDALLIAGHGPSTDVPALREFRDMVAEVLRRVEAGRSEGKTLAELEEAGILDDLAERWEPEGAFIDRHAILGTVWEELERE